MSLMTAALHNGRFFLFSKNRNFLSLVWWFDTLLIIIIPKINKFVGPDKHGPGNWNSCLCFACIHHSFACFWLLLVWLARKVNTMQGCYVREGRDATTQWKSVHVGVCVYVSCSYLYIWITPVPRVLVHLDTGWYLCCC